MALYVLLRLPLFSADNDGNAQVVVLHGLGRSEAAMLSLENHLAGAGFDVHNIGYPSNDAPPEALTAMVGRAVEDCCVNNGRPLHFVGHSLGGLIIRAYLEQDRPDNLVHVVLLGTPNGGSELADQSGGIASVVASYAGPTARLLGTGPDDFPAGIGAPTYPVRE